MRLFQPRDSLAPTESRALMVERRSLKELSRIRQQEEREYKEFLEKKRADVASIEQRHLELENEMRAVIENLRSQIGSLEKRKQELEESTDEQVYQRKYAALAVWEKEAAAERSALRVEMTEQEERRWHLLEAADSLQEEREAFQAEKEAFAVKALETRDELQRREKRCLDIERSLQETEEHLSRKTAILTERLREVALKEALAERVKEEFEKHRESLQAEAKLIASRRSSLNTAIKTYERETGRKL